MLHRKSILHISLYKLIQYIYFLSYFKKKKTSFLYFFICFIISLLNFQLFNKIDFKYRYVSNLLNNTSLLKFTFDFSVRKNNYFFWRFFSNDSLIKSFINIIMKSGKKYNSYNTIYKSFFFLKKLIGFQPILLLKKFLYKYRFLFNIQYLTLRYKVITLHKYLSVKSQINRTIKFILNNLKVSNLKFKNKFLCFNKKLSYLILNFLLNHTVFKKKIMLQSNILNKKFNFFFKYEENKNKYMSNVIHNKKPKFFKNKKVKIRKRIIKKSIRNRNYNLIGFNRAHTFLLEKQELLSKYNIHVLSKKKIKHKWI